MATSLLTPQPNDTAFNALDRALSEENFEARNRPFGAPRLGTLSACFLVC